MYFVSGPETKKGKCTIIVKKKKEIAILVHLLNVPILFFRLIKQLMKKSPGIYFRIDLY